MSTDTQSQGVSGKTLNFGEMARQKLQKGRGRPRSRTASVDRAPKAQDIYSLLLEIKEKQETGQTDIGHLNTKMGNLQKNIDSNFNTLKVKTSELELHVLDLHNSQTLSDEKLSNLEVRTSKIEGELGNQNSEREQLEEKLIDRVAQTEYELAADIETVKNNIEEQMAYEKQIQMQLENRFANFTKELESENIKMKDSLRELKTNLENLKMINIPNETETKTTASSRYDHSVSSTSSQGSENLYDNLYMFGDVSRSLILDGIRESRQENLHEIVHHCINSIGIPLTMNDIESVVRIGAWTEDRKQPRPVKLILKEQTVRDQIFHFKLRLRHSHIFRSVLQENES